MTRGYLRGNEMWYLRLERIEEELKKMNKILSELLEIEKHREGTFNRINRQVKNLKRGKKKLT